MGGGKYLVEQIWDRKISCCEHKIILFDDTVKMEMAAVHRDKITGFAFVKGVVV